MIHGGHGLGHTVTHNGHGFGGTTINLGHGSGHGSGHGLRHGLGCGLWQLQGCSLLYCIILLLKKYKFAKKIILNATLL